ncbi:hypothetical protein MtrunA17_Chr2g0279281 [Medicago truncatula]|uniref:Peroxisomal membrane 22 kDa (Mpv17/PMP22) family protein n=1 Tax=Medicago truncatula TaxID=3880 RepID=A0A396J4W4_MEDTR|nr:hypothetical protein MtrunA17_Chr2g0279281 [Medicago truncatula]
MQKSGENRPEVIARLKQDLRLFWPVCDIVTFGFIPVHLQPLMNSCCAYLWIVYCSRIAKRTNLTEA